MTDDIDMLAPPVADGSLPPAEIAAEWVAYLNSGLATDADFAQLEAWLDRMGASTLHHTVLEKSSASMPRATSSC